MTTPPSLRTSTSPTLLPNLYLFPIAHSARMHSAVAHGETSYHLGTHERSLTITTAMQMRVVTQLAQGRDPLHDIAAQDVEAVGECIDQLASANLLMQRAPSLQIPVRYMDRSNENDASISHLRDRALPEIVESSWRDGGTHGDGDALMKRQNSPITLMGHSRTLVLLHSILLSSGASNIRLVADGHLIDSSDIAISDIRMNDIGTSLVAHCDAKRREISLFPTAREKERTAVSHAGLVIFDRTVDPAMLADSMTSGRPHLFIGQPCGDEMQIGPLVIAGKTPCLRCWHLYEKDRWGYSMSERISLTDSSSVELPIHIAHVVAGVVASAVLTFIDSLSLATSSERAHLLVSLPLVGEVLFMRYSHLTHPQEIDFGFHPLCGCQTLMQSLKQR